MIYLKNKIKLFDDEKINIDEKNCLIHKPFCELCKTKKHWKIAKIIILYRDNFYSICIDCFENLKKRKFKNENKIS